MLSTPWRALQQHFAEALSLSLVTEARQQLQGCLLYIVELSLQSGVKNRSLSLEVLSEYLQKASAVRLK